MPSFTSTTNHDSPIDELELPKGDSHRLHLVDVKARVASDITLEANNKSASATINAAPFSGPKGIWVVTVQAANTGDVVISAKHKGEVVATLKLKVIEKTTLVLPPESTVEGMLTRLFLAESVNPGNAVAYNPDDSKKSMLWMRKVVENRLAHATPKIFNAIKAVGKAYTIYDIVRAPGQFHGFENYPTIDTSIKINLTGFLQIANNYSHSSRLVYSQFIADAVSAAGPNAMKGFTDPSKKGLYGWRTKGSSAPGGDFVVYQDLAGQTFYTLK